MAAFVNEDSILRKIWGNADTVLFIFAGAAAEFALNKAVDWLYFTGKLPADPLERLFSTVEYARKIIFSEYDEAIKAIDQITAIHQGVEQARGRHIPDWAYRDVLFMLIDYSIRAFELLDRSLIIAEKAEIFEVFYRVGLQMNLKDLPVGYHQWELMRRDHLERNLAYSNFTTDLFKQYRKHLGPLRYFLLTQVQARVIPRVVKNLLNINSKLLLEPALGAYKFLRMMRLEEFIKNALLPVKYKAKINALNYSV